VISLEHSTVIIGVFKFKFKYPVYSILKKKNLIEVSLFHYKYWSEYLLCGRLQWERTAVESLNFLTLCLQPSSCKSSALTTRPSWLVKDLIHWVCITAGAWQDAMACLEEDSNRLDVSRRYSAIYGRFDSKRPPHKQMNFHEVRHYCCCCWQTCQSFSCDNKEFVGITLCSQCTICCHRIWWQSQTAWRPLVNPLQILAECCSTVCTCHYCQWSDKNDVIQKTRST